MSVNRYAASSLQTSKLPFLQILAPLLETGQIKEDIKLSKKQVKMAVLKVKCVLRWTVFKHNFFDGGRS